MKDTSTVEQVIKAQTLHVAVKTERNVHTRQNKGIDNQLTRDNNRKFKSARGTPITRDRSRFNFTGQISKTNIEGKKTTTRNVLKRQNYHIENYIPHKESRKKTVTAKNREHLSSHFKHALPCYHGNRTGKNSENIRTE